MTVLSFIVAAAEGAEHTSKTAFYIAGGLFAAWAVLIGIIGINRPGFPSGAGTARLAMVLGVVLMLGAMSTAVITA